MIADRVCGLTALPMAVAALLAGLLMLSAHPIGGVLVLLFAMGLALRLVGEVCGAPRVPCSNGTQHQAAHGKGELLGE